MIKIETCSVCNKSDFDPYLQTKDYFFTEELFDISKCKNCGFVFTNPVPDPDNIARYYGTDKYLSHDTNSNGLLGKLYSGIRKFNLKSKHSIIQKFLNGGKVLDIGCGTGEFLNYLKTRNWSTLGIEPEKKARDFAINNYGLEIFEESKLNEFQKESFDLISMWHVLEHVYNLKQRLQIIHDILTDDGYFINALPMVDSPDALRFEKYWAGLDVPRHLYHFSSETFEILADATGFEIVEKFPMKFDSYYVSYLSHQALGNYFPLLRGLVDGFISNMKADAKRNYSSMIFVMKKK